MAEFTTLYTGKGLATQLPTDTGKAMNRLSDFITRGEEMRYKAFKENKDWFLKTQDVDPVMFLTTANQDAQARLMREYNEASAAVIHEAGGFANLSHQAQTKILAGKNYLISKQQEMQADMARALQDRDAISKDIRGELDHDEFSQRWNNYMSGKSNYGAAPLSPSAIDPDAYYSRDINKGRGTEGTISVTTTKGGITTTEKKYASGTEEEGRSMVRADILGNDRLALGYIKKFQDLKNTDPETYVRYLDTSGDQKVSPSEEQAAQSASNPIIKWAEDNYWQKRLIIKNFEITKPVTTRSTTFNWNLGIGGGNNRNGQYDIQGQTDFDGLVVNSWLNLGKDATTPRTQQVQDYIDTKTGEKKYFGSAAEIKAVGYSPDKDMIIAQVTETSSNRQLRENKYIGLPGDRYDDLLRSKPFGIDRGALLKKTVETKTITPNKKVFNPITGQFEEPKK